MEEPDDNSIEADSRSLSHPTGEGIVIDIGTGDGRFVYQSARDNPRKFFIGIDASPRLLEKVSEKIHRKPAKGGLPNVIFVQAAVEELPCELDGVADEVHIHFPWGSLLQAVARGDDRVLKNIRRICADDCLLEIIIGLDAERDRTEMERLGLKPLTTEFMETELALRYKAAGFEIVESGRLTQSDWSRLESSWARRLQSGAGREVTYIIARAC